MMPITLNQQQADALSSFKSFLNSDEKVFILKGHAGTGKTSLVNIFVNWLKEQEIPSVLMATTGRAAKVLAEKTGYSADTVHRTVYTFDDIGIDEKKDVRFMRFRLSRNLDMPNTVYFVDESSMLSSIPAKSMELSFGTGILLYDLLSYIGDRKIVFVGDPAQLPPINQVTSPALNPKYFTERLNIKVQEVKLTEVMRFNSNSGIFSTINSLRQIIENPPVNVNPVIRARGRNDMIIYNDLDTLVRSYAVMASANDPGNQVFISNSNSFVHNTNQTIRRLIFKEKAYMVHTGEPLLVIQNNYLYSLYNGDTVRVVSIEEESETKFGIVFKNAVVQSSTGLGVINISCKIMYSLLSENTVNISSEQEKHLYQDFYIKLSKRNIRKNSNEFMNALMTDPYLNALRVKYGYAMTCHKAQGGEWKNVFLNLEASMFMVMPKESLHRWIYTAISRSSKNVFFANNYCLI